MLGSLALGAASWSAAGADGLQQVPTTHIESHMAMPASLVSERAQWENAYTAPAVSHLLCAGAAVRSLSDNRVVG